MIEEVEGEVDRLLAVLDNRRLGGTSTYHFYVLLFRVRVVGGSPMPSRESLEVRYFEPAEIPRDMSAFQRAQVACALAGARDVVFQ